MEVETISLGDGANVVKYSGTGETAVIKDQTKKDSIATAVASAASSADTINNVKVGDKINISKVIGSSASLLNGGNAYDAIKDTVAVSTAVDVFLLKNGADYFLVYEGTGSSGNASSLGSNAEVIKLVGLTDANKITLDAGIVTIV